jgi:hypothetical protein
MMQFKEANGKKITDHIIKQYQKIDSPPFSTGFNMIVVQGSSTTDTKHGWLCILLEWTNSTRHDLITCNLWPKSEVKTSQELNTMPMHDKQWDTDVNSLKYHGTTAKSKHGQILQQNSQLQDQYPPHQQQINPPSATIHTFLRMLSHK